MSLLNADQIVERMQGIGPHVFYHAEPHEGKYIHSFRVQDVSSGPPRHAAYMAVIVEDKDLLLDESAIDLEEGKRRYESFGAKR